MMEIVVPAWILHGTIDERLPIYSCHVSPAGTHLATGGGGESLPASVRRACADARAKRGRAVQRRVHARSRRGRRGRRVSPRGRLGAWARREPHVYARARRWRAGGQQNARARAPPRARLRAD